MLPRWRDEVQLLVTPGRVALRRLARGLRPRVTQHARLDASHAPALGWTGALETLDALLASTPARGADATVVVSSHFVRYGLVPASDLLVTQEDEANFARQNFVRIHGAAAERWSVRVSGAAADGGAPASGIEQGLVDALRALLERHGLRPRALVPVLMAAYNHARRSLPAGGCRLVVHEPGIAVSALLAPAWKRLRSQRIADPAGEALVRLIERERALEDEPATETITCVVPLLPLAGALETTDGPELRVLEPVWPAQADAAGDAGAKEAA